jgi:hypothetical protein
MNNTRLRHKLPFGIGIALALALGACAGGSLPSIPAVPSLGIPTMPPDDFASGTAACIDAPTMAVIDQLRATGADVPALLAEHKDLLILGLEGLESSDPVTVAWRDAFVGALESGDADAAAAEVARLASGEVTLTPC